MRVASPPSIPHFREPKGSKIDGGSTEEREVKGMKKEMDKIQFEYRYEVQELMKVIDKYVKQNPAEKENKTLERFFDLLDVMDMEW